MTVTSTTPESIAERLRAYRASHGMTQAQLAEEAGLSREHMSRLEQGRHLPTRAVAERISLVTGIAVEELIVPIPLCSECGRPLPRRRAA